MSESEIAFFTALTTLQSDLPHIGKGQTAKVPMKSGGSYSYTYADLSDIAAAILPLLSKNGLAFTSAGVMTERGFVLRSSLVHVAGHREVSEYPLPDVSRSTPQDIGGAMTYGRRYSLCCLTGVTPGGDDDDAASASRARPQTAQEFNNKWESAPLPDAEQAAWIAAWIAEVAAAGDLAALRLAWKRLAEARKTGAIPLAAADACLETWKVAAAGKKEAAEPEVPEPVVDWPDVVQPGETE